MPGNAGAGTPEGLGGIYRLQPALATLCSREPYAGTGTLVSLLVLELSPLSSMLVVVACAKRTGPRSQQAENPLLVQPLAVAAVLPSVPPHPPLSVLPRPSKLLAACYPPHPPWKWQRCLCKLGSKGFTVLFHRVQTAGGYVEPMRGLRQDPALQPRSQSAGWTDETV